MPSTAEEASEPGGGGGVTQLLHSSKQPSHAQKGGWGNSPRLVFVSLSSNSTSPPPTPFSPPLPPLAALRHSSWRKLIKSRRVLGSSLPRRALQLALRATGRTGCQVAFDLPGLRCKGQRFVFSMRVCVWRYDLKITQSAHLPEQTQDTKRRKP